MKKYAVAFISFIENDLQIEIVLTDGSWKDALVDSQFIDKDICDTLDDFIETAKQQAFDQDWLFEVKEIK